MLGNSEVTGAWVGYNAPFPLPSTVKISCAAPLVGNEAKNPVMGSVYKAGQPPLLLCHTECDGKGLKRLIAIRPCQNG